MSEQEELAPEVGDDVVREAPAETEVEAEAQEEVTTEETEAPAEPDSPDSEEMTKSKAKRERAKARLREAEARAEAAEAEAARIKKALGSMPEPQEADFDDYEDFRIAKALFNRDKGRAAGEISAREQAAQQAAEAAKQEAMASFAEQEHEARAKFSDYDQVTRSMPLKPETLELALRTDAAPDVIYHLGKNPTLAHAVAGMHPMAQAIELGRIEARLAMAQPKKITQAAEPIRPVGATSATVSKNPGDMTPQEYRAWRESGGTF